MKAAVGRDTDEYRRPASDLYKAVLDGAPDAILVVTAKGRVMVCNHAATEMFGYAEDELLGIDLEELLPEADRDSHRRFRADYNKYPRARPMGTHLDLKGLRKDGVLFPVDIMLSPVRTGPETVVVAVIRDITVKERERRAREELLQSLQSAEHRIKTLSGLLPICAWCKNIRDDNGYWSRLEEYFQAHSDIDFTHGICPDCAREFSQRLKKHSQGPR